jgi:hypothetical protein
MGKSRGSNPRTWKVKCVVCTSKVGGDMPTCLLVYRPPDESHILMIHTK